MTVPVISRNETIVSTEFAFISPQNPDLFSGPHSAIPHGFLRFCHCFRFVLFFASTFHSLELVLSPPLSCTLYKNHTYIDTRRDNDGRGEIAEKYVCLITVDSRLDYL